MTTKLRTRTSLLGAVLTAAVISTACGTSGVQTGTDPRSGITEPGPASAGTQIGSAFGSAALGALAGQGTLASQTLASQIATAALDTARIAFSASH